MSTPDEEFLDGLEIEVDAELTMVESSRQEDPGPASSWQFDPTDLDREEASLQSLRGAIEALEDKNI